MAGVWQSTVAAMSIKRKWILFRSDGCVMLCIQAKQWAAGVQHGRLQKAAGLQLEAFWQHHRSKVLAAGGVALIYILWSVRKGSFSAHLGAMEHSGRQAAPRRQRLKSFVW